MKICFLFPGQGAQYPGMVKDLWEASGGVRELFESASDQTSIDLERLIFEGSEAELKATDKTQIAVTLANLSVSLALRERGIECSGCAGFSLGEYGALHEAGVIRSEDIFSIVKIRGRLMEDASRALDTPSGRAGMAAVIGLSYEEAAEVLKKNQGLQAYLALHNSPSQIVISGTADALKIAQELFDTAGAMKYVALKTSGPFHSPLLEQASLDFSQALASFAFSDPGKPVYSNVTGRLIESGDEARLLCGQQIVSTIQWVAEEQSILDEGYDRFLEVGPGAVLTGLWKRFHKKIRCEPAGKLEQIEKIC